jgi:hypothetical protein
LGAKFANVWGATNLALFTALATLSPAALFAAFTPTAALTAFAFFANGATWAFARIATTVIAAVAPA